MPTPGIAANTYAQLARIADPTGGGLAKGLAGGLSKTIGDDAGGPNFGAMLKDALQDVAAAGRKSDTQVAAVANGKANVIDVITAVAEAQTAVDTLVAVRDSVIQSYQQILSMPI
jgi:flagellar hook-basal body complex protein FliE